MKKTLLFVILFTYSLFASDITIKDFESLDFIKQNNIKVKEFKALDDIYLLNGIRATRYGESPFSFSVSKDLKYTFIGKLYDNTTTKEIYIKNSPIPYKKDASFVYGKGIKEYYLFTDLECPYCIKFEKKLLNLDLKDKVKIYYYLYPLAFHKEATPMSRYILSQKNDKEKQKALKNIMIENSTLYKDKVYTSDELDFLNKKLKTIKDITTNLAIRGTPTILKPDGTKLNTIEFFKEIHGR